MQFTKSTLLTLLPLLPLTTAADVSTVSLFTYHAATTAGAGIPEFSLSSIPLGASIISANPTATTMAVSCLNDDNCILPSPITVTAGPSTYTLSAVYSTSMEGVQEVLTIVEDCKITGVTQGASCSVSYGVEATYKGVSTSTASNTQMSIASAEIGYETVSVTGGADKLSGATATGTATGSASGSTETGMAGRNAVGAGALAMGVAIAGLGML
ncbi:putative GPI anchored cell wall protein [Aspergillus vadensis CBS 113365]|uniref:GPI anchored cell wall protein n=1 Tax=Aspergillus vadensis (strain CBS 113365 / IMI 142717 / IBT 24658) TaxID=1448311 RepID=A0A319B8V4_ASPVC|nr:hypothetical protein BO88DRAFT_444011 [Aspergillus vadensis CBS 113365]PYH68779.1 hypothetical protein BO88DRAFT_444011 [Aspergillus vadensis CBS 113365]